ncbi:uncharacterized protein F5891DRAFT_982986 [Suillus fuscotomentosus]|uniref:Uncharacterized protein n=1 Tax=Suillus fuscotomentosus TaxID=1912939 RepID=A0AAD4E0H8_9AGAM|nr:uncharacterized protein F5891DRAFT_982986 [Suillus fuscotomentosus]KAG1896971.1 hypothetical protein F5891DRAFT_982986 [Suillus fuscotomentosus]
MAATATTQNKTHHHQSRTCWYRARPRIYVKTTLHLRAAVMFRGGLDAPGSKSCWTLELAWTRRYFGIEYSVIDGRIAQCHARKVADYVPICKYDAESKIGLLGLITEWEGVSGTEFEGNCSGIMALKLELVQEVVRCFKTQAWGRRKVSTGTQTWTALAYGAIVLYDENQHAIVKRDEK